MRDDDNLIVGRHEGGLHKFDKAGWWVDTPSHGVRTLIEDANWTGHVAVGMRCHRDHDAKPADGCPRFKAVAVEAND